VRSDHRPSTFLNTSARVCFMLLIIALPWTIAPMSITVVLCGAFTVIFWLRSGRPWEPTPVDFPALGWAIALILSACFAVDRSASLMRLNKALFPLLVPLVAFHTSNRKDGARALTALLMSSALASLFGIVLFIHRGGGFMARSRGAVGHYMTFGGQLLLIASLAVAVALLARSRAWRLGSLAVAVAAMIAIAGTFTRSAWIGLAVSLAVIFAAVRPRWTILLAAVLVAIWFFAPDSYRERAQSAFDPHHPMNLERTYMWEAGLRMFRDHPITGIGLQDLRAVYDRYRSPDATQRAGHLHSVPVQIAATMGIIGLVAYLFLYGALFRAAAEGLRPMLRKPDLGAGVRLGVVAALAGFLVAGLFEWNFGDEELLFLLYAMVGLAWGARRWSNDGEVATANAVATAPNARIAESRAAKAPA